MDRPLFVVGNDRSGTTMLRLILDRSPELAIPPESMFLADFAPLRRRGGLDTRPAQERFLARVWSHPKVRLWQLPEGPPELPEGLDHAAAYRFCVESPFVAYARAQGKPRWGDKTPWYLLHAEELLAVWPRARFLVLERDGRDVALSVLSMPWGPNNVWSAARWWASGIRAGLELERRHPEQVLRVRYESLASGPAPEVERICAFLGLPYDRQMLEIERSERSKVLEDQRGWFTDLWSGINTSAVGKWRTAMSGSDQQLFAALAGAELEALGYEAGVGRPAAAPRSALYALEDVGVRLLNLVRLRVIQERGRELGYSIRRKLLRA